MRSRMLVFLGVLSVLAVFTGLKAAEALPSHPYAAMAGAVGLVATFVGWMLADRGGLIREGSRASRVLAWTASAAMAVWTTFLLLSAVSSLAELVLSAAPGGAALAQSLPAAAAGASLLIAGLGFREALSGPRVKEVRVPVRGLAPGLRGLKIAQISDLHVGPTIRRRAVERVVARTLALEPDLIAVTGDLADGTPDRLAGALEPLARLKAPLGVYYVPGNHEYYWGAQEWLAKARELGWTLLVNENRLVSRGLLVAGVPDEQGGLFVPGHEPDHRRAAAGNDRADFRLLLAHRPDGANEAARAGFDLQLSGHTHGGQFFPASLFIGLFHRYARGLDRAGNMWIYVSPGTGYWGPANRFGVPSEITVLTLVEAEVKVN
jgi:predicted MPP superfamily phosphohydrolase